MLYVISDGKYCKVGWSKKPKARLKQLQTAHPSPLKLLATFPTKPSTEKQLHYILKDCRARHSGEWFDIDYDSLVDIIQCYVTQTC